MNSLTLPGLIDPHVHLRDPGQTEKEDFLTGSQAALAGGFTTILDMPNNSIPITKKQLLDKKIQDAMGKTLCDVGFYFGTLGDNTDEFDSIAHQVHGLKVYLNETTGNFQIDKEKLITIYQAWPEHGGPILLHAENEAVVFALEVVEKIKKPTHFCHIGNAKDLSLIISAKKKNLPITCGVTPHHLFLTIDDAKRLGPLGQMKPPLYTNEDKTFLWKQIKNIDAIESDHAPHTIAEKQKIPSPFGVPGLETTLPLLITAVRDGKLNQEDILRLCFTNPSRIFSITSSENTSVDVDITTPYTIRNSTLYTKCKWSPFDGMAVIGKVIKARIRGTTVFENGSFLVPPGWGWTV